MWIALCLVACLQEPVETLPTEPVMDVARAAQTAHITAGPMVGYVASDRARIWVQASGPGWFGIEARMSTDALWRREQLEGEPRRFKLEADRDYAAVLEIGDLQPGKRYYYRLYNAEGAVPESSTQSFATPPAPGTPADLRIAFGSCAKLTDGDGHTRIFRTIDALEPDAMLWLGDNLYYTRADEEWTAPDLMNARYRKQRAQPSLQPLFARTPQLGTWDDHDFGPNNSDKRYVLKEVSLALFERYWANGAYGSDGAPGVWHSFEWGRVEFFFLDLRMHREPDWSQDGPGKTQLGAAQWQWLERGLRSSKADFKVIVSSIQVLADYHKYESWRPYPEDRRRLFALLADAQIGGVLFLSGDRHLGEVLKTKPAGAPYPTFDFTSSPLAAGVGPLKPDDELPARVPGTGVREPHFGWLEFRFGGAEGPSVSMQARNEQGRPFYEPVVVPLSALQP